MVLGPFQNADQKDQSVFLVTDLGFDERTLWCKVATNYDPFIFPTAKLGLVPIAAHRFSMRAARPKPGGWIAWILCRKLQVHHAQALGSL
jgi:hypothetical protein